MLTGVVFVCQPPEMADPSRYLLRLRKAPYGLSDATLARVLTREVGLRTMTGDSAVSYGAKEPRETTYGLLMTRVDDVLSAGSIAFHQRTLHLECVFDAKPRESIPLSFSGVHITPIPSSGFTIHQPNYAAHLCIRPSYADFDSFRSLPH